MLKKLASIYTIKVWLISIILGPIVIPVVFFLKEDFELRGSQETGPFEFYFIFLLTGFIYSIPTIVLSTYVYKFLLSIDLKFVFIKSILILLGFILFALTFSYMGYPLHEIREIESWTIPASYSFFFLLASLISKIEPKTKAIA